MKIYFRIPLMFIILVLFSFCIYPQKISCTSKFKVETDKIQSPTMSIATKLSVQVYDHSSLLLQEAVVSLDIAGIVHKAIFNKLSGAYELNNLPTGKYEITISAEGFETQKKIISLLDGTFSEIFILGLKGMSYYYKGTMKVPFQANTNILGIVLLSTVNDKTAILTNLEKSFSIKPLEAKAFNYKNGLFIYEYPVGLSEEKKEELRNSIQKTEGLKLAGPVLNLSDKHATLLTDEIIVKFKTTVSENEAIKIIKENGFENLRRINYIPNAYLLKSKAGNGYTILDLSTKLLETDLLEYAEPNTFSTSEDD